MFFTLVNAHSTEIAAVKRAVLAISHSSVPSNANIIELHFLYNMKQGADATLKLEACIRRHEIEVFENDSIKNDCCVYATLSACVLMSIVTEDH